MNAAIRDTCRYGLIFTAGFLTRPCCVIPAALSVAGLSGAGIAAAMAPWRPWFLLLAVVLFAVSFHWNFIRNRSRPGMVVWGISVLLATLLFIGPARSALQPAPVTTMEVSSMNATTITLAVEGMACTACSRRLESVLATVEGISQATVSYDDKRATVTYDPDRIDAESIRHHIQETGFTPGSLSEKN